MLEGFQDEETYAKLTQSSAFPLVRELQFKYNLKVARKTPIGGVPYADAWLMAHPNGTAVGKAFVARVHKNPSPDMSNEYCFRTPYYSKERGRTREDKETIRSVKVSSLMASLARHNVIPTPDDMERRKVKNVDGALRQLRNDLGVSAKNAELSCDEIHALLLTALGRSPSSEWVKVDQNKCQAVLDRYEEADRLRKVKTEESQRMFYNPFWMIGVDEFGDYLIGKFKVIRPASDMAPIVYETVSPFRRYASYEQVPELVPLMTMVKVAYENAHRRAGVIPVTDRYDQNLDAVFVFNTSPTHYDQAWMITSCST
jgi:hypothetical protein